MAESIPGHGGVFFVPALAGLGAPFWNATVTGQFHGLSRKTSSADLVKSVLESVLFQCQSLVEHLNIDRLKVDGGMTQNKWLMQAQANLLEIPIDVPENLESSCFGAAAMAAESASFWDYNTTLSQQIKTQYLPQKSTIKTAYQEWRSLIEKSLS